MSLKQSLRPLYNEKPVNEEAYKEHVKNLEVQLKKFEELYLKSGGFIFGDEISIADLTGIYR